MASGWRWRRPWPSRRRRSRPQVLFSKRGHHPYGIEKTPAPRRVLSDAFGILERPTRNGTANRWPPLIRRHLAGAARDTPRRAVGCSVVLLPEDEAKLTEEITYHETTGRIMPRASRRNTVNPRIPYRRKPS